mmetsp:Transcript_14640/g.23837  ORF Transcript_14640/g.23837 Transcript_14640/m.23837 type:complete len:484 (-) Transcript_14640:29-1480(-)|eukprot:CAMPEP_0203790168 /NCGR_PEP_ID=MMETSP0100_2-20121128/3892_1 /ASSEMBLY_ACC=CAM_ASM_000210 /TAXON_ID=96639 /ORGANISM=" , Strain NY0313808BC1" /LENGTH=483 /DNA_ID=CAMNT_0050693271 /DNA_START=220 /DNA_END=1671 /DNA_ORIENTATION=-
MVLCGGRLGMHVGIGRGLVPGAVGRRVFSNGRRRFCTPAGSSLVKVPAEKGPAAGKKGTRWSNVLLGAAVGAGVAFQFLSYLEGNQQMRDSLPPQLVEFLMGGLQQARVVLGQDVKDKEELSENVVSSWRQSLAKIPEYCRPQDAVLSPDQKNGLFLTIHLGKRASVEECAVSTAQAVQKISSEFEKNGSDSAIAVGFSERVWNSVQSKIPAGIPTHPFDYHTRKGEHGSMPATGGDIFLHMKSNNRGQCFSVARRVVEAIPVESIIDAEDVYGYEYENGKDLLGYSLHRCNNENEENRFETAVVKNTGGSYALSQLWRHRLYEFEDLSEEAQNQVIGKCKKTDEYLVDDRAEVDLGSDTPTDLDQAILHGLPATSHVARVIGVDQHSKKLKIVRQGMPCGSIAPGPVGQDNIQEPGLSFLAYANNPTIFNYMLARMVGTPIRGSIKEKRPNDQIMEYSKCIRGQMYYVPSKQQLAALTQLLL